MGVDFIRKRAKVFRRSWDRHRLELCQRTLFTKEPSWITDSAVAKAISPHSASLGEQVIVRAEASSLVAVREMLVVATFINPPPELLETVANGGGYAVGTISRISSEGIMEISVC